MKNPSFLIVRFSGLIITLLLAALLVMQSSCGPTGRLGKEKHGMVPCPCEKRNSRR